MSSLVLTGDTSGQVTLAAPAVAGSNTLTLLAATATSSVNTLSTAVASTSGTSIEFINLPAWVKKITVMLNTVSTNGTNVFQLQLGTGATPTYTIAGYSSGCSTTSNVSTATITTGLAINNNVGAVDSITLIATIINITGNTWVCAGSGSITGGAGRVFGGSIALGAALTAVRLIASGTGNPADTFDLGTINILYEG